jgi:hypothetical protein
MSSSWRGKLIDLYSKKIVFYPLFGIFVQRLSPKQYYAQASILPITLKIESLSDLSHCDTVKGGCAHEIPCKSTPNDRKYPNMAHLLLT